jgi:quinol monooxygenase YgiN
MFARVIEFTPKLEKKDELFKVVGQQVLPILRKQPGFLEYLPLIPENTNEKFITIGLWAEKTDAERFIKNEAFAQVEQTLKPFLTTPTACTVREYNVETTVCQHLVDTLTAAA